jgi:hypothetical protein
MDVDAEVVNRTPLMVDGIPSSSSTRSDVNPRNKRQSLQVFVQETPPAADGKEMKVFQSERLQGNLRAQSPVLEEIFASNTELEIVERYLQSPASLSMRALGKKFRIHNLWNIRMKKAKIARPSDWKNLLQFCQEHTER